MGIKKIGKSDSIEESTIYKCPVCSDIYGTALGAFSCCDIDGEEGYYCNDCACHFDDDFCPECNKLAVEHYECNACGKKSKSEFIILTCDCNHSIFDNQEGGKNEH